MTLKTLAFYLPQFHPTPLNDELWGRGFTEWTHVAAARPLFRGHRQPRLPSDLGFYDLRVVDTHRQQARLAADHGIDGFCYWYYWYDGRRELEQPMQLVLDDSDADFPLCLGWANHPWTTGWAGGGRLVIPFEDNGTAMYERFFRDIEPIIHSPRYVLYQGQPVLYLYRPLAFSRPERFVDRIRELAEESSLPGVCLVGEAGSLDEVDRVLETGYDFATALPLRYLRAHRSSGQRAVARLARRLGRPVTIPYSSVIRRQLQWMRERALLLPMAITDFDNTPRYGRDGFILQGSTPQAFERQTAELLDEELTRARDHLLFVKSWNEWAEGNYLEPDQRYGTAYLTGLDRQVREARHRT